MADSAAPSGGRVFISYRHEETAYAAGWLFNRLADRYGRGQIFKDIDSIQLGDDFVEEITTAVGSCDVLLALIGERWLTITDEHGQARLDDPDDFVRLEIEAALTRKVRVIPILVAGARMPRPDQLPPSLATLVHRQALELSPSHFEFDTGRLLKVLDSTLAEVHVEPASTEPDADGTHRDAARRDRRRAARVVGQGRDAHQRAIMTRKTAALMSGAAILLVAIIVGSFALFGPKAKLLTDSGPTASAVPSQLVIISVTFRTVPDKDLVKVTGTVTGLAKFETVYAIAQLDLPKIRTYGAPNETSTPWFVGGPADVRNDGSWITEITVKPPTKLPLTVTAVKVRAIKECVPGSNPGSNAICGNAACATGADCPISALPPPDAVQSLANAGTGASFVAAVSRPVQASPTTP